MIYTPEGVISEEPGLLTLHFQNSHAVAWLGAFLNSGKEPGKVAACRMGCLSLSGGALDLPARGPEFQSSASGKEKEK